MNPIEFLRQFRVGEYAVFDMVAAFGGMYLLAPWLSRLLLRLGIVFPKLNFVILALPIGILVHVLVGSMTPMTKAFLDPGGHYTIKIVSMVLLILGCRGVKGVKQRRSK